MNTELNFKTLQDDLTFKYIFSHEIFLNDLINSFLEYQNLNLKVAFTKIEAQNYMLANKQMVKGFYGDLVGILNNENMVSIEMYKDKYNKRSFNKSICYLCRLFTNQMHLQDERYEDIKKVIGINFIKGNFRRQNNEIINPYRIENAVTKKVIDDGTMELYLIRLDLIELAYKEKKEYNGINEKRFIKWLRIINAKSLQEIEEIAKEDWIMEELKKFVTEWCAESGRNGLDKYISKVKFEAEEKGELKGELRGRKEGKKEGLIAGKKEASRNIAQNMLNEGMPVDKIIKITGLTRKQIMTLL